MGCFQQAPLVLAHLRMNETLAQVAAAFGVSPSAAWRYVDETVEIQAAWTPSLHEARARATSSPTTGCRDQADEPYYSQRHKKPHERPGRHQTARHPPPTASSKPA
ncbi:transposase family protein [Streptomyces massasporeus]|uniref:helix-turn-helix domain-containing protein n=1 Tax=Streptomyces massasporeus TaxID=67324 RepID=UPI0036CDBD36